MTVVLNDFMSEQPLDPLENLPNNSYNLLDNSTHHSTVSKNLLNVPPDDANESK